MADDNANKAGGDGAATDDKSAKAGSDKAGNKAGANGGDQQTDDKKSKPITFDSQKDLDDFIATRLQRDRRNRNKNDDGDAGDDDDKKLAKKFKSDPEKEALQRRVLLSDAKDAFIIKTGLPYDRALRVWGLVANDVEFSDDGKPLNLTELDKKMRSDFPELYPAKVKGKSDGGNGDGKKASAGESIDSWLRSK